MRAGGDDGDGSDDADEADARIARLALGRRDDAHEMRAGETRSTLPTKKRGARHVARASRTRSVSVTQRNLDAEFCRFREGAHARYRIDQPRGSSERESASYYPHHQ